MNRKLAVIYIIVLLLACCTFTFWLISEPDLYEGSIYFNMGNALFRQGRLNEAIEAYQKSEEVGFYKVNLHEKIYNLRKGIEQGLILLDLELDRWMGKEANIIVTKNINNSILKIIGDAPIKAHLPLQILVSSENKILDEFVIEESGNFIKEVIIDEIKTPAKIKLISNKTFIPKSLGINEDTRELSIRIKDMKLESIAQRIDFKDKIIQILSGIYKDKWTSNTVKIFIQKKDEEKTLDLIIKGEVPEFIHNFPITLAIFQGDRSIKSIVIEEYGDFYIEVPFKDITFDTDDCAIIKLNIDRTFIPQEQGISDDTRELGVLVHEVKIANN